MEQDFLMDLEQFRAVFAAGGVVGVTVEAAGNAFAVIIQTRGGRGPLVKIHDKVPRFYRSLDKAMGMLYEVGMRRNIEVDMTKWQPNKKNVGER